MRAIRSVLHQTYDRLELIVVDDASTDDTPILVARLDDARVRHIRNARNSGAAAARNLGVRHATGELLAFQDSDDEWLLDKLAFQVGTISRLGSAYGATFGGKILCGRDERGNSGPARVCFRPSGSLAIRSGAMTATLLQGNAISPQTLLLRRAAFEAAGPFDDRLPANEDWDFMLRLAETTLIEFTMRPLVVAHVSTDSLSFNDRRSARSFIMILRKQRHILEQDITSYRSKWFATAVFLRRLGRLAAAERCILRAIAVQPYHPEGWLRLVHLKLLKYMKRLAFRK
jgi:glycosyltransferase involved in cell wall biosynthesis